jgi:glycosyltransferase involved in cell wall biosynthesis
MAYSTEFLRQAAPMDQTRIALVTGGLPFGGTTTFCMFLGKGLNDLGVPVRVFSFTSTHPLRGDFDALGVSVHRENEQRLIFEDRVAGVHEAMRVFRPTAVFAVIGSEALELLRYLPQGIFRVAMIHDHYLPLYNELPIYRGYYDHVVAVAANIAAYIREHFPNTPCSYLRHGVLLNAPEKIRAANPSGPLKIIYFGRLEDSSKRVRIFPQIWAELRKVGVPFEWTIHGTGPDEQFLRENLAEAERSGEVVFSKPVPYDQLGEIIRKHDVYLLTSVHEAGPLALVEAMGYGLVPVSADIPCLLQEVLAPNNGFKIKPDDPFSYAAAINQLHKNRQMLEAFSRAARSTVERDFSEAAMARRYLDFVNRHPRPSAPITWEKEIQVQPILQSTNSILTARPFRPLRRLLKNVNSIHARIKTA